MHELKSRQQIADAECVGTAVQPEWRLWAI